MAIIFFLLIWSSKSCVAMSTENNLKSKCKKSSKNRKVTFTYRVFPRWFHHSVNILNVAEMIFFLLKTKKTICLLKENKIPCISSKY